MKKIRFVFWSWIVFQIEYLLMPPLTIDEKKKIIVSAKDKLRVASKRKEMLSMCICLVQALMEYKRGSFKILKSYNLRASVVRRKKFFRNFTAKKLGDKDYITRWKRSGSGFNQDRDYWFDPENLNGRISALNKLLKLEK